MYTTTAPATANKELTPENAEIVKATLPLIGSKIEEITPVFYRTMFGKHPELIANVFNRGNQKSGEQQKALAASIATFAAMLVDDNAPDPIEMLSRIGHKHVSLGIKPEEYKIVHDNLFAAIVEVIGAETITDEVAAAWDEVYWLMADVLIDFERELYESAGVDAGDVFRKATIVSRKQLSDKVMEFTFQAPGFADARPGQYTSIGVVLPDGARQLRQYSLVDSNDEQFTIAVQRDGEVSNFLMDEIADGEQVDATLPAGDLVLQEDDAPVVLVSQGIGSTPMTGMLRALASENKKNVTAIHADESAETYAQRELTEQLAPQHITAYRASGELVNIPALIEGGKVPKEARWYLCGGNTFLQDIRTQLSDNAELVQAAGVHYELFSPNDWLVS